MPACWLLAGEADQIQDVVFRSASLAQVVGGSARISAFCREAAPAIVQAVDPKAKLLVHDGGVIRLVVKQSDDEGRRRAWRIGERLANEYSAATGGSITFAPPVGYDETAPDSYTTAYKQAAQRADRLLRAGKQTGDHVALDLPPLIALCEDCGRAPASALRSLEREPAPRYRCDGCLGRRAARNDLFGESGNPLLKPVLEALWLAEGNPDAPIEPVLALRPPPDLNRLAVVDPRREVAFIVADGNGAGPYFSDAQSPRDTIQRSNDLSDAVCAALAAVLVALRRVPEYEGRPPFSLYIRGGDDIFLAVPAQYALVAADVLARSFEQAMKSALSLSIGVVLAKPSYPYTLAYRRAAALLAQAKRLALDLRAVGFIASAVAFDRAYGLERAAAMPNRPYRWEAQPYLAGNPTATAGADPTVVDRPLHVRRLLEAHKQLDLLPRGRRQQLRELYDDERLTRAQNDIDLDGWRRDLEDARERIIEHSNGAQKSVVDWLLCTLGDTKASGYWRPRPVRGDLGYFHGLPDAILAWPYSAALPEPTTLLEPTVEPAMAAITGEEGAP
jgi:hypothetical protein